MHVRVRQGCCKQIDCHQNLLKINGQTGGETELSGDYILACAAVHVAAFNAPMTPIRPIDEPVATN